MHFHIPYELYAERYPTKTAALYHALRDRIVSGALPEQTLLPSTRGMARMYGLSRGTVNQVYEMLASEGYLSCQTGRGTFVSFAGGTPSSPETAEPRFRLSAWAGRLEAPSRLTDVETEYGLSPPGIPMVNFASGWTDLRAFPYDEWNRVMYAQVRELGKAPADPTMTARGNPLLRESIARYLRRMRGLVVQPQDIAVVGGSMQAIAILAQLLLDPGEAAVAERPGFAGIRRAIRTAGGRIIEAEVDGEGIVPADWDARLLFVTPTRQFPTGAVLSMERRLALLRWAAERGAVIVEDDYDSEFRHRGRSLEPLKALDREGRVVYIGSFSKTLPPAFRIGYAALPPGLARPFEKVQALYEPYPVNQLEQRTLAAFMAAGLYERHLRRMKRQYSRKFEWLRRLLQEELSEWFEWVESDAGLHIFGWWRHSEEAYGEYKRQCAEAGVYWSESEPVTGGDGNRRIGTYFHFAGLTEEELEEGVRRMKICARRG